MTNSTALHGTTKASTMKENPGDLKWTRIPESYKEEAAHYTAEEIMAIYKSPDTTDSLKQWCRDMMLTKMERYIYEQIHLSFSSFCPTHVCEFFQNGTIGLIRAMNANYQPNQGKFITYARGYIVHELSRFAGYLMNGQTSHYSLLYKKVLKAQSDLKARGIEPTTALISIMTDLPESSVRKTLAIQTCTDFVYLDGMEDSSALTESFDTPEKAFEEKEKNDRVHRALEDVTSPIGKKVIKMYYGVCITDTDMGDIPEKGMNLREIADRLGIPCSRVKAELNKALSDMRSTKKDANGKYVTEFGQDIADRCKNARKDLNSIDIRKPSHDEMVAEMESTAAAIVEFDLENGFNLPDFFCA